MTSFSEDATRYPLAWPIGWKRTPYHQRRVAMFNKHVLRGTPESSYRRKDRLEVGDGLARLDGELRRLGPQRVVISSNLRLRGDGLPYASQAKRLDDPGVAVYFRLKTEPRVLACDRWNSAADNMAAIAGHIEAIRTQERYGVGTLEQAFAGYAALPPVGGTQGGDWRAELGFSPALDGTLQVHLSASAVEDTTCYREASAKGVDWFLSYAVGRWQQLAQLSTEPEFLGLTAGKGVPHWFVRVAS